MGLAALALAYVYSQFYRSFLAVVSPELAADLGAGPGDLSAASGAWFVAFGLMQFGVGVGLDRFGPRLTAGVLFGVFGCGGALAFAFAGSPGQLAAAMVLIGIGCAPVLMAAFYLFVRRFEPARFAVLASSFVAFGNLGNVLGTSPMAGAVEAFGWRATVLALALGNLVVAGAILLCVRDPHDPVPDPGTAASRVRPDAADSRTAPPGLRGYLVLLRSARLWAVFPIVLLCYAPVAGLRGLWVGPWLVDLHGADATLVGRVTLAMACAMIAGSALYGPLDRWFDTRKRVILAGNLVVLCALVALASRPDMALGTATALLVIIGLAGMSYAVAMAHGRAFVPAALTGRGVTLLNFFSIAGVGLLQFGSAAFVGLRADPASPETYRWLFAGYAACLAVALAIYLGARDAPPSADAPSSRPPSIVPPASDPSSSRSPSRPSS